MTLLMKECLRYSNVRSTDTIKKACEKNGATYVDLKDPNDFSNKMSNFGIVVDDYPAQGDCEVYTPKLVGVYKTVKDTPLSISERLVGVRYTERYEGRLHDMKYFRDVMFGAPYYGFTLGKMTYYSPDSCPTCGCGTDDRMHMIDCDKLPYNEVMRVWRKSKDGYWMDDKIASIEVKMRDTVTFMRNGYVTFSELDYRENFDKIVKIIQMGERDR